MLVTYFSIKTYPQTILTNLDDSEKNLRAKDFTLLAVLSRIPWHRTSM